MKIISIVLLSGLLIAPSSVWSQTVTEKAKAKIAKEKEDLRVEEASNLLKEKKDKEARIIEINDRLDKLNKGAEPDVYVKGKTVVSYTNNGTVCCEYITHR